jgi:hypothetical protein
MKEQSCYPTRRSLLSTPTLFPIRLTMIQKYAGLAYPHRSPPSKPLDALTVLRTNHPLIVDTPFQPSYSELRPMGKPIWTSLKCNHIAQPERGDEYSTEDSTAFFLDDDNVQLLPAIYV